MRDEPGWLGLAHGDQVTQLPIVFLHRALAAADTLTFEPLQAVIDGNFAILGVLVDAAGIYGQKDADNTDTAGARLLFQVIADGYEKRSLIITTNLEFSKPHRFAVTYAS